MDTRIFKMLILLTLDGLKNTIGVFFITLVISIPLSIVVGKLRMSKNRFLRKITGVYIYIMRGTPLLLQLMFIFFGFHFVPYIGYAFSRYQAIYIAFVLNYTAYFAEIFRGGMGTIDTGQFEAGDVLGLSRAYTFLKVILPQVIKNVMPSVGNEIITLVKDTSLVYILGVGDILKAAKAVSNTYSTFIPYIFIGLLYLLITAVLTKALSRIEKKFNYYR